MELNKSWMYWKILSKLVGFLLLFCFIYSCKSQKVKSSELDKSNVALPIFPYNLDEFSSFSLDPKLDEISGLCLSSDESELVAIQDEDGILFFLDKQSGEILSELPFGPKGDYEGVCNSNESYFILKSSGTVYEVNSNKDLNVIKHKHVLNKKDDHEGITFDKESSMQLIACKDNIGMGNAGNNMRCIYSVDLKSSDKKENSFLNLSREDIQNYLLKNCAEKDIQENFDKIFDEELDYLHVGPSGLAIHPKTNNLYILSSKGKILMVVNRKSEIQKIVKLDKKIHPQPEGIAIDENGNLYIANEKKNKEFATLVIYKQSIPYNNSVEF